MRAAKQKGTDAGLSKPLEHLGLYDMIYAVSNV